MDVWKRACRLSVSVYRELATLKDFGFKDQITRSGLSIVRQVWRVAPYGAVPTRVVAVG